jgi:hypothetical protein
MKHEVRILKQALSHDLSVWISSIILAVLAGVFLARLYPAGDYSQIHVFIAVMAFLVWFFATAYSVSIRRQNKILGKLPETVRIINHGYRVSLESLFGNNREPTVQEFFEEELRVLNLVCFELALYYSILIRNRCTVTVKFITEGNDIDSYACQTVACSDHFGGLRDGDFGAKKYYIKENTAFLKALDNKNIGISYFHSYDLRKIPPDKYSNKRGNWNELYWSTIVVPIKGLMKNERNLDESNLIGFLAVDTKSANYLNNSTHVRLLSAMADQMYNYVSLISGSYKLRVTEKGNEQ